MVRKTRGVQFWLIHSDTCFYCNRKLNKNNVTIDHVKPISKGGNNDIENMVYCCNKCNSVKADMTLGQFVTENTRLLKWCPAGSERRREMEYYIGIFRKAQERIKRRNTKL